MGGSGFKVTRIEKSHPNQAGPCPETTRALGTLGFLWSRNLIWLKNKTEEWLASNGQQTTIPLLGVNVVVLFI